MYHTVDELHLAYNGATLVAGMGGLLGVEATTAGVYHWYRWSVEQYRLVFAFSTLGPGAGYTVLED